MSDMGSGGGDNPFEGLPMFRDLARLFAGQGPINWDIARQIAVWTAAEGEAEGNVDPMERIRFEELLRVADLHVTNATGLSTTLGGGLLSVTPPPGPTGPSRPSMPGGPSSSGWPRRCRPPATPRAPAPIPPHSCWAT